MKHMKTTNDILEKLILEKNLAPATADIYKRTVFFFENHIGMTLPEFLEKVKEEEKNPEIIWADSLLRNSLVSFRNEMYNTFKESSAGTYFSKIPAICRHFGITVKKLPTFSTKQTNKSTPIYPEDLPDREMLQKCIEVKNPMLKAATLLMSSTGLSRVDTLRLKVSDYLEATKEYHNHLDNPFLAIQDLEVCKVDVIPTFKSSRRKTGINYVTFASPEAAHAINLYLMTRDNIDVNDRLFKMSSWHFNKHFREANDILNLGKVNGVSRFTPQMLRRYHASQLNEAGMSSDKIDILQGRTPKGLIHQSYIRIKTKTLKEEYIRCLPFLVIQEIEKIRTELDVVKDENVVLKEENEKYKELVDSIDERIEKKIFEAMKVGLSEEEIDDLFS